MSDNSWNKIIKWWKHESFRIHVSEKNKEYKLKVYDDKINKLVMEKNELLQKQPEKLTYMQGRNKKQIKKFLIDWDDEMINDTMSTYKHPSDLKKSGKSVFRFFEAMFM
tara:strand:+ start:1506 stop:1832 length:327 start_codon:yes stop_codon:yes gene_type:complete